MFDKILFSLCYSMATLALLYEIEKYKYNFGLRKLPNLLLLIVSQYLNTGIYLINMRIDPSFINAIILSLALLISLIWLIYNAIICDKIYSTFIAIFFILILTIIILTICYIFVISDKGYFITTAFALILIYMFILELPIIKMKNKLNIVIYTSFIIVLATFCSLTLYIAYQTPNELTANAIKNVITSYGEMPDIGTNDIINIYLYYMTKVYIFFAIALPATITTNTLVKLFRK